MLVVAPLSTHSDPWRVTLEKWALGSVTLLSYCALRRAGEPLQADVIIYDEAHCLKDKGTLQSQAARRASATATWVIGLTATPMEKKEKEIISIFSALGHVGLSAGLLWRYVHRLERDDTTLPALPELREETLFYDMELCAEDTTKWNETVLKRKKTQQLHLLEADPLLISTSISSQCMCLLVRTLRELQERHAKIRGRKPC